jgi:hypothetical protein
MGLSRSVEIWDSSSNSFTTDTSFQAGFANLNIGNNDMVAGLTPVLSDGSVLLYKLLSLRDDVSVGSAQVCRYVISTRTVATCIQPQTAAGVGGTVRLYRNALIFGTAAGPGNGLRFAWPALDQRSSGHPVICFGSTCSAGGQDFVYYQ